MKTAKQIIFDAYKITLSHRDRLFAFGFVPSFFSLLVSGFYLFYQIQSFRYSPFFGGKRGDFLFDFLKKMVEILTQNSLFLFGGIFLIFLIFLGWFFAPMLCRAAIANAVFDLKKNRAIQKPLAKSFFQFFPLFKIAVLKRGLEPTAFFTEWSFAARHLGGAATAILSPLLIFFGILAAVFLFFLSFTTQAIVLKKKDFIGAIVSSFKTVFANFGISLKLLLMFLLIEIRVLINALLVLSIPAILIAATGFFAFLFTDAIGIFLAGIIVFLLVILAAYLTGILFVFSEVMWTVAFFEFETEKNAKK